MFDNNDQNQQAAATTAPVPADSSAPVIDASQPATTTPSVTTDISAPVPDQSFNATPVTIDPVSTPAADPVAASSSTTAPDLSAPVPDLSSGITLPDGPATVTDDSAPLDASAPSLDTAPAATGGGDLLSIKQDALQSLSPLLSQLDQSAEEKFRTTMMLIQASDDQSLIQSAYAAAKDISDEKVRAQALLDIVNEINYFTQSKPAA